MNLTAQPRPFPPLLKAIFLFMGLLLLVLNQARAQSTYCTTNLYTNGCSANDQIDLFTFGTISNATSTCGPDGYTDYTSLSATVSKGNTYTMTMRSNPAQAQGFGVWIDYNNDKDFDDAGEMVYNSAATGTQLFSTTVLIPSTAATGATRLRVRSIRSAVPVANGACTQFTYGETEDYTVNITGPQQYCTGNLYSSYCSSGMNSLIITNVTFGTINNSNANCPSSGRYSNYTNISTTVQLGTVYPYSITVPQASSGMAQSVGIWIDYNRDFDFDDPGEFVASQNANFSPQTGNITIAQNATPGPVRMRIRSSTNYSITAGQSCSLFTNGETEDYTLNLAGTTQYCTLNLHQNLCSFNSNYAISHFSLGTFVHNSGCGANGYQDFSAQTANLVRGQAYPLSISTNSNSGFGIWIDFNEDLIFDASEFVFQSAASSSPTITATLTLPTTGALGTKRMRVRAFTNKIPQSSESCVFQYFGETEDYTVTITAPPSPIDAGITEITSLNNACGLGATEKAKVIVKNFGTTSQTNFAVSYAVNGTTIGTETVGKVLAPGDTTLITFSALANLSAAQIHKIKAWTSLAADAVAQNDTLTKQVTNYGNGITNFPATENFETFVPMLDALGNIVQIGLFKNGWSNANDDNNDWKVSGQNTRAKFNPSANGDHTTGYGNFVNFSGSGSNSSTANLESPCVTLSSLQVPTLEFWYHVIGNANGTLAVDVHAGGTWTNNVFTLTGAQQTGQAAPWLKASVPLTAFIGQTIRLRFRGSVSGTGNLVMALDDIRLLDQAAPLNDVGISGITKPTGSSCDKTATEQVCVNLINSGNSTRKNFSVTYKINNQPAVTEVFADSLLPGQTKQFCFAATANLQPAATYKLTAYTNLSGDQDRVNDTLKFTFTNKVSMANFSFTNTSGSTFQFTSQYVNTGAYIQWNFGDGQVGGTLNPSHQYALPGIYTVTMVSDDFQGCRSTIQKVVTVLGGSVVNDVSVAQLVKPVAGTACNLGQQEEICLNVTNAGNVVQKQFTISYQVNNLPVITQTLADSLLPGQTKLFCFATKANLSQPGAFNIKAWSNLASDNNRANDTISRTIIHQLSILDFTFTTGTGNLVNFTAANLNAGSLVKWHFGDGDSSMVANPAHQYQAAGTYTVTLTGTDTQGCTFTVQKTVSVGVTGISEDFEANFSLYPNPATEVITLQLKNAKAYDYELISVLGQKVVTGKIAGGTTEQKLSVKDLPAGTYTLRLITANRSFFKTIIVTR